MKKLAIAIALVLALLTQPANAACTWVRTSTCNSAGVTGSTFTCPITTPATGNDLFVGAFAFNGGASCTLTVTGFASIATTGGGDSCSSGSWITVGASPPTTVVLNSTAAGAAFVGVVAECNGCATTSAVDKSATCNPTGANATTCVNSAVVPTQTGDCIFMWSGNETGTSAGTASSAPSNTFTQVPILDSTFGIRGDSATAVDSSSSSLVGTWTWSPAQTNQGGIVLINPSVAPTHRIVPWIGAMR